MSKGEGCLWSFMALAGVVLVAVVAFVAGDVMGSQGPKMRRYSVERDAIAAALAGDPAFRDLSIEINTRDGSASLGGRVSTKADYDRLRSKVGEALLKARDNDAVEGVGLKEETK